MGTTGRIRRPDLQNLNNIKKPISTQEGRDATKNNRLPDFIGCDDKPVLHAGVCGQRTRSQTGPGSGRILSPENF
jgi:hypothetical protein